MILLLNGDSEKIAVSAPKVGRRYEAIVLELHDFQALARLSPEMLHAWVEHWMLGFPPGPDDDTH